MLIFIMLYKYRLERKAKDEYLHLYSNEYIYQRNMKNINKI